MSLASGVGAPFLAPGGAAATSVASLRSRAAALARRIDTIQTKLQILSEEYDQARGRAASLGTQMRAETTAIGAARRRVTADDRALRRQAIDAYVTAGSGGGIVLSGNAGALPMQQTYLSVASDSLDSAITSLHDSQHRLQVHRETLAVERHRAARAVATIAGARRSALALEGQLRAAEASASGQLADAVQAQEAAQRAAAAAAAAATARQAAAQLAAASAPAAAPASASPGAAAAPATTATTAPAPPAPSGAVGTAAVAAARTQLGVPYVWGGAAPGAGFDCSGLTMWAWSQAGVSLPHSAQAQYDSIEHVPLSELQPGDLVFYASGGYIYHVIMYIGGGEAIQAETAGTPVQITPVWPGAYGAGRP